MTSPSGLVSPGALGIEIDTIFRTISAYEYPFYRHHMELMKRQEKEQRRRLKADKKIRKEYKKQKKLAKMMQENPEMIFEVSDGEEGEIR